MPAERYIGLMSGTSADAIDAALATFSPAPSVTASHRLHLPSELQRCLRAITRETPVGVVAELDVQLGVLFATAVNELLAREGLPASEIQAIGSHGQTIWHAPAGPHPYTLQIGDPNVIAERTGIATVADFRRRDVAAGGQGAPLVPAFHAQVFASADEDRCVLNLGGIANVTVLRHGAPEATFGFDTGPANTLLDAWIGKHRGVSCDRGGAWAASGKAIPELLDTLLRDPYFGLTPPKSTGREHFSLGWLEAALGDTTRRPEDVQATLVELTAVNVADAIMAHAPATQRLLVCGGGVHNPEVMRALERHLPGRTVESTARHGIDPDLVEACAFAWLARQTVLGLAGNLPAVTGARHPVVLGGIFSAGLR